MATKSIEPVADTVPVSHGDLLAAWKALEKLVVSLRKIGSHYATPDENTPLSPERRSEMHRELEAFISPELWRELAHARRLLAVHLPEEELERLSEHEIRYWEHEAKHGNDSD